MYVKALGLACSRHANFKYCVAASKRNKTRYGNERVYGLLTNFGHSHFYLYDPVGKKLAWITHRDPEKRVLLN